MPAKILVINPEDDNIVTANDLLLLTKKYSAIIFGEETELYSPADVPANAYLFFNPVTKNLGYIQFTDHGIVITNGVFFARRPLGEYSRGACRIWKGENEWIAWFAGKLVRFCDGIMWDEQILDQDSIEHDEYNGSKLSEFETYTVVNEKDGIIVYQSVNRQITLQHTVLPKNALERVIVNRKYYVPWYLIRKF